ncbi:MAG: hypothetical protein SFY92_07440 [Verrucomicrobiae bacterium]|nr:hypothetical protein [Verrucomicrobiae bacterium]
MPFPLLDRTGLRIKPLTARKNKFRIEDIFVRPTESPRDLSPESLSKIPEIISRIRQARSSGRPVILAFGAHAIKNGLGPLMIRLIGEGWITHLATNGAGIIHDWEFSFQGASSEDVRAYVQEGQFGIWQETCSHINLAIVVGAYEGLGYGESVGRLIENEGLTLPDTATLEQNVREWMPADADRASAALDLLDVLRRFGLKPGFLAIPHPHKQYSIQASACRLKVPFTGHPMIGHDIIYNHPMNHGAAIGRAALRDFLCYAENIRQIEGGVYLSVGSAVMSPMIFEKAFSMAQNLAIQKGRHIDSHYIAVVDLAQAPWDWARHGEPPIDNPAYYLRYCKTFNRMGGTMQYLTADNRDFLLALYQGLTKN